MGPLIGRAAGMSCRVQGGSGFWDTSRGRREAHGVAERE